MYPRKMRSPPKKFLKLFIVPRPGNYEQADISLSPDQVDKCQYKNVSPFACVNTAQSSLTGVNQNFVFLPNGRFPRPDTNYRGARPKFRVSSERTSSSA